MDTRRMILIMVLAAAGVASGSVAAGNVAIDPTGVLLAQAGTRSRGSEMDAATDELRAAEAALEESKRRQEAGVEPLGGERTGNVNGSTRLNEAYEKRQEALKEAVTEAEKRVERALQRRNAAR